MAECLAGFDEASQQDRPRKHVEGKTNLFPPYVRCQGNMLEECWIMLNHVESIILVICDHSRSLLNTLGPSWSCSTRCLHRSSMAFCQGLTKPAFGYWLRCKVEGDVLSSLDHAKVGNRRHPAELLLEALFRVLRAVSHRLRLRVCLICKELHELLCWFVLYILRSSCIMPILGRQMSTGIQGWSWQAWALFQNPVLKFTRKDWSQRLVSIHGIWWTGMIDYRIGTWTMFPVLDQWDIVMDLIWFWFENGWVCMVCEILWHLSL